jgi:alanyl-tRNA synthetase
MTGNEIRSTFLKFFADRGHRIVRSSSLVPVNDPTLLFTNAGMNQFKDVFLGLEQREYTRATSSQKCVRAGGKHNDLENVGFTNRHHTFFEMLGNFSFGDYFKKDAVAYAWELITSPNWFNIPVEKLYFTVFGGAEVAPGKVLGVDEEALNLWLNVGAPKDRVIPVPGLKENFWAMGDTGPCGPCSELHYDMGPAASDQGHTDCKFGCECGRYVEIWNLVFMQFNRDASGTVSPLPKPSIDTGAGLERLAAVLQGKISNFDTDLFDPLIEAVDRLTGYMYGTDVEFVNASMRIIADHARACTFLIGDGVMPSNEGRGYVLRKILRRAASHGRKLGLDRPFMHEMVFAVRDAMKFAYPDIEESIDRVAAVVTAEEKRFARTIATGLKALEFDLDTIQVERKIATDLAGLDKATADRLGEIETEMEEAKNEISRSPRYAGEKAFRLYDTFGLPRDFIEDIVRDSGITVDWAAFDQAMEKQRTRARASWRGGHKEAAASQYTQIASVFTTEPDFYHAISARDCKIEAIIKANVNVSEIIAGEEAEVVLDRTVIYAESGGQVADTGAFFDDSGSLQVAEVKGAYYPVAGLVVHRIVARETLRGGDRVSVVADGARREHIKRNHTATHLMHAALRNILGTHVKQAGSLVEPGRLRFDFSHFAAIDAAELRDIEQQVNDEILLNSEIQTDVTTIDDALASGALAFFGDRYPEQNVRVVTIPDPSAPRGFYSKELCGGTHVRRTGDIGVFKIAVEQSTAAGVRRIEAITGAAALADYQHARQLLHEIASRLGVNEENLAAAIERAEQTQRQLEKQLDALKRKGALSKLDNLAANARTIKGIKVISAEIEGVDRDTMRQLVDSLRQKLGSGVVVLGAAEDGKVALLAGVTKDLTSRLHAGKIVQATAKEVGGSGGGRPDLAEAGGKDTSRLKTALDLVYPLVEQML